MKRLLIFLFFISFNGNSQELFNKYLNFEIENDNKIAYKKVFELEDNSKEDIIEYFKINSDIEIKITSDELIGEIKGVKIDYKKYGGTEMNTMTVLNYKMFAKIKIQFREDRYRVILREIIFMNKGKVIKTNNKTDLEIVIKSHPITGTKKSEFKKNNFEMKSLSPGDVFSLLKCGNSPKNEDYVTT